MYGFNPVKGLSIMLLVFAGVDYILLGGRFSRQVLRALGGLF